MHTLTHNLNYGRIHIDVMFSCSGKLVYFFIAGRTTINEELEEMLEQGNPTVGCQRKGSKEISDALAEAKRTLAEALEFHSSIKKLNHKQLRSWKLM